MRISSQMANRMASKKVRYKRLVSENLSWHPANMKLRVKQLRNNSGLNAEQLAEMAGISKSYMSEIETGKKWPSGRVLQSIARQLGVSIYDLIDEDSLGAEIATHISAMRDLSDDDRKAVLRHAAVLLEQGASRDQ